MVKRSTLRRHIRLLLLLLLLLYHLHLRLHLRLHDLRHLLLMQRWMRHRRELPIVLHVAIHGIRRELHMR